MIVAAISFLIVGSLGIAQGLIFLFPSDQASHFHWNLLGVALTVFALLITFYHYKNHPFLTEVYYVLKLKKALSLVSRKLHKLEAAAQIGNENAMLALMFSYAGSRQLWELDDNTITMGQLNKHQQKLEDVIKEFQVNIDIENYNSELLKGF